MSSTLKNILIIVGTLLLGVIIGFLISGMITRVRIDNMRSNFARQGMDYRFMRALNPSQEQKENIRPIFDKYNEIRRAQLEGHLEKQKAVFKDFEEELRPYLNQDQLDKMEMIKHNLGNNFPGFQRKIKGKGRQHRGGQGQNRQCK